MGRTGSTPTGRLPYRAEVEKEKGKGIDMTPEEKLQELGHTLPAAPEPRGVYLTTVEVDGLIYTAASSCFEDGNPKYRGKLGSDLTVEQGRDAAECTMLNLLSVVKQRIGDLDKIDRMVKVTGHIASAPGFDSQPEVLNAASELLGNILGERGRHARSVVGVNELPMNVPIVIDMIVKLKD